MSLVLNAKQFHRVSDQTLGPHSPPQLDGGLSPVRIAAWCGLTSGI